MQNSDQSRISPSILPPRGNLGGQYLRCLRSYSCKKGLPTAFRARNYEAKHSSNGAKIYLIGDQLPPGSDVLVLGDYAANKQAD